MQQMWGKYVDLVPKIWEKRKDSGEIAVFSMNLVYIVQSHERNIEG
jgi:hypothetical protein